MRHLFRIALGATFLVAPGVAAAQDLTTQSGTFVVTPRAGWVNYAKATSLEPAGFLGFEAVYRLQPWLSLGPSISISQATTRKEDFPAAFSYADSTFIFLVRQPVTIFDAGLVAHGTLPTFGRVAPFVAAGAGYSTFYLDPQAEGADERLGMMTFQAGVGADVRFSNTTGIRLEVRDFGFLGYDRERLNPVAPQFRAYDRFQGILPARTSSEKDATMHNLVFSIGFTFTPSLSGTDEEDNQ